MSKNYIVLLVDQPTPPHNPNIDMQPAQVFMRFHEWPEQDFLKRLAEQHPDKRVYCLMGASTWTEA